MRTKLMLIALLGLAILPCAGQKSGATQPQAGSRVQDRLDVGLLFTEKWSKITNTTAYYFTMPGGAVELSYNFKKYDNRWSIVADVQGETATQPPALGYGLNQFTVVGGPRYTVWRKSDTDPRSANIFLEAFFGGMHGWNSMFMNSQGGAKSAASSWSAQMGAGLNLPLDKKWSWRVAQLDYIATDLPNSANNFQGDTRFSTGVTYHLGAVAVETPLTLACAASPASIYPGDPVTITSTAAGLDPKLNAIYSYTGSGVTGNGATAQVATGALGPGTHMVNCGVKEGKPGKEGLEMGQFAASTASFAVKAFDAPTINCSANPSTIKPGETATITASGMSPQNRPLTYSYSATSGSVSGTGASAVFSSSGAPIGSIAIVCYAKDDKGQTAVANTGVTVVAPPPPPPPPPAPEIAVLEKELALHSIYFPTAKPTAQNPEEGLLASQQDTLATLASSFEKYLTYKSSAHLILAGHADPRGTAEYNQALTERRVNRAKTFLVERGVPAGNIEVQALGANDELSADQVKKLIEDNPELSAADQKKMLAKLPTIVLANNRRVDVTLSTTGQQSTRIYPFNAKDALTLLSPQSTAKQPVAAEKKPAAAPNPKK
jgi:outer membrane protein OmpA-like peptidoglycan-associated protein